MQPCERLIESVNHLRRYARLTSSTREEAEENTRTALYYVLKNRTDCDDPRVAIFATYQALLNSLDLMREGVSSPQRGDNDTSADAVLRLPLRERRALILMDVEDFSEEEAGYILDCPPHEAACLAAHAKAAIGRTLQPFYERPAA